MGANKIVKRGRILLSLARKFGIKKIIAARKASKESNYVLTYCPVCGTEHRVHKLRAKHSSVRCKGCKTEFIVSSIPRKRG